MEIEATVLVKATGTGAIVGTQKLMEEEVVNASRIEKKFMTTTLPNVITDLITIAKERDPDTCIELTIPSTFVSADLSIILKGGDFTINCERKLARFFWFPFMAEFGSNYNILVSTNSTSQEFQTIIRSHLEGSYKCIPRVGFE